MDEQSHSIINPGEEYMAKSDLEMSMICHDRHFRDTVFLDDSGNRIFALDCAALFTSLTIRRTLRDAAGSVCLQVRHEKLGMERWVIEDARGKPVCEAKGSKTAKTQATRIEAKILVGPGAGSVAVLQSVDSAGSSTSFELSGRGVAEMALTENNDLSFLGRRGLDRSAWRLKVTAGTDLALVAALAVCRAEILHAWRR